MDIFIGWGVVGVRLPIFLINLFLDNINLFDKMGIVSYSLTNNYMKTAKTIERYIPEGYIPLRKEKVGEVFYHPERLTAIAYKGRSKKPVWHYSFKTLENIKKKTEGLFNRLNNWEKLKAERKEKRKLEKAQARKQVEVGDIFHASWGWEQTNCDFYKVVKKEGAYMFLKRLYNKMVEHYSSMAGTCVPVKNSFTDDEPLKVLISFSPKVQHNTWASPWDGNAKYISWYA